MRVRLTYSVEFDQVPEHVAQLIDDEWQSISYCDHLIQEIISTLNEEEPFIDSSLKKIDTIRQALGSLDLRLSECENILEGFVQAQQSHPSEEPAIDQQFDGQYNTPYEVPKESQK